MSITIVENHRKCEIEQYELTDRLIDQVRRAGPEHLYMGAFGRASGRGINYGIVLDVDISDIPHKIKRLDRCGTTVCHAGHQAVLAQRLHLIDRDEYKCSPAYYLHELFDVDFDSFSASHHAWPRTMRRTFLAQHGCMTTEGRPHAEWIALLSYLAEVRERQYREFLKSQPQAPQEEAPTPCQAFPSTPSDRILVGASQP